MTFIVDGTNGATFPDTTVQTTALTTGSVTKAMVNTSTANGFGLCRAWVNFTGNGSAVIQASYNVSSVTYSSAGNYIVNFSTAMPNANYAVGNSVQTSTILGSLRLDTLLTTSVSFRTTTAANSAADASLVTISVFSS